VLPIAVVYGEMDAEAAYHKAVLHPVHGPGTIEALRRIDGIRVEAPEDSDGVVAALEAGAEILITFVWEDRFLAGGLRWVQAVSAGMDQFPLEAFRARDVRLSSARGAHAPAVAEHAIALLLAVVRGLGPPMHDIPDRRWSVQPAFEVEGRTLGILGLGAIGEEIARRAVGLGMRVIGTKRRPELYVGVAERALGPERTIDVCQQADAVVVALPHSAETIGLVGRSELAALRDGWLVNVGRGPVVDETALIDALTDGTLRGAGLDVFEVEPLPATSPLWDIPTVVMTPHSAWSSDRLVDRLVALFEQNLRAYLGLGPWKTLMV